MNEYLVSFEEIKNPVNVVFTRFLGHFSCVMVELQGVEPWSKHIRHKSSTCLFLHYLSGISRSKTNQLFP